MKPKAHVAVIQRREGRGNMMPHAPHNPLGTKRHYGLYSSLTQEVSAWNTRANHDFYRYFMFNKHKRDFVFKENILDPVEGVNSFYETNKKNYSSVWLLVLCQIFRHCVCSTPTKVCTHFLKSLE